MDDDCILVMAPMEMLSIMFIMMIVDENKVMTNAIMLFMVVLLIMYVHFSFFYFVCLIFFVYKIQKTKQKIFINQMLSDLFDR